MKLNNNIRLSGVSHQSACVGELQDHTCLGLVYRVSQKSNP